MHDEYYGILDDSKLYRGGQYEAQLQSEGWRVPSEKLNIGSHLDYTFATVIM